LDCWPNGLRWVLLRTQRLCLRHRLHRLPQFPDRCAFQAAPAGGTDAFVAKISPSGNPLAYSTYLGGSAWDAGRGIAVDAAGRACVAGETASANFPLANPVQGTRGGEEADAFVTCLNPAGSGLTYSTYLGGRDADAASSIALDSAGSAYITGLTAPGISRPLLPSRADVPAMSMLS